MRIILPSGIQIEDVSPIMVAALLGMDKRARKPQPEKVDNDEPVYQDDDSKQCLNCGEIFNRNGLPDGFWNRKIYCSDECKHAFHYKRRRHARITKIQRLSQPKTHTSAKMSDEEIKKFIIENYKTMTDAEIANKLNKQTTFIRKLRLADGLFRDKSSDVSSDYNACIGCGALITQDKTYCDKCGEQFVTYKPRAREGEFDFGRLTTKHISGFDDIRPVLNMLVDTKLAIGPDMIKGIGDNLSLWQEIAGKIMRYESDILKHYDFGGNIRFKFDVATNKLSLV